MRLKINLNKKVQSLRIKKNIIMNKIKVYLQKTIGYVLPCIKKITSEVFYRLFTKIKWKCFKVYLQKWGKAYFHLFFAFSLIASLFYLRLVPRVARNLWENMTDYQLFSTLLSITLLLVNIYIILKLLYDIKPKNSKYLEFLSEKALEIKEYIFWSLENFYDFLWYPWRLLAEYVFGVTYFQYQVIRKVVQHFNRNFAIYCYSLMAIKYFPRIIFVLAFVFDVLLFNRLDWTFQCIPLLLLVYFERVYMHQIDAFYTRKAKGIRSFLIIKPIEGTDTAYIEFIPKFTDENPPEICESFDDFYRNHFLVIQDVEENLSNYKLWKTEIFPSYYIELALSVTRLLVFIFILGHGVM